jgi:hypothetical protein
MDETTLAAVLWGATALLLGWTWIPAFISGLGGTRFSNGGSDDPTAIASPAGEADYAFWYHQIIALGYGPVGPAWIRINLSGPNWRYETPVRVFYSRTEQTFIFIQKQPRPMDVWWLTIFATCWQDGGLLLTNNQVDEAPEDGHYVLQGMESTDLAAVAELHRGQRDRIQAAGKRPIADGHIDTMLKATSEYARVSARQVGLRLGQSYLASHFLIHLLLTGPLIALTGFINWPAPLANLLLGSLLATGEYVARRRSGLIMRKTLLAQMAADPASL